MPQASAIWSEKARLEYLQALWYSTFGFVQGAVQYLVGGGQDVEVDFGVYDPGWGPSDFPGFDEALREVCEYPDSTLGWERTRERDLYREGFNTILKIGGPGEYNVTIGGSFSSSIDVNGQVRWNFSGNVEIPSDKFNFNPLPIGQRTIPGEIITRIMWYEHTFKGWGTDFDVNFVGGPRAVFASGEFSP